MSRLAKYFLAALLCGAAVGSVSAFSLLGPVGGGTDAYQVPLIGYGIGSDIGAPKERTESYRWTVPILSYAFDQNFLDFFGSNGVAAVDEAMAILNEVMSTNMSSWSSDLHEFSLDTTRMNYLASALNLYDVKSMIMAGMLEQLGLAEPTRWAWVIHDRTVQTPPGCPTVIYNIIQRNYDPVTFEPSSYVNGVLFSYQIQENCNPPNPVADTVEFAVDAGAATYTAVADWRAGILAGQFYTGLTRDDCGALRFLYRASNVAFEPVPPNSRMIAGGLTNNTTPQTLTTLNLGALVAQSGTNSAAQLQALFPGLVITDTQTFPVKEVSTNITAYFTNLPTSPVNSPATLKVLTTLSTNFVTHYHHTFGNVVTNSYSTNTWIVRQTVTSVLPPSSPVGSTNLITTVSPNKFKPVLTNLVSGDFYILPANLCGYSVIDQIVNVTPITNVVLQVNATNQGTAGTNVTVTNVGQQSYTIQEITWFTNRTLLVYPIDCGDTNANLRRGIDRIQFVKVAYDSLIGRALVPITNRFNSVIITNGVNYTQRWERVTTAPDFLFTASDLGAGFPILQRTTPRFAADAAAAGGALAGPGTISAPVQLTLNKIGPSYNNAGPATIVGEGKTTNQVLGSFNGSTNLPIAYPNTISISNLMNQFFNQALP